MGFFDKIAGFYKRVIQSVQDARDVIFNLPEKIEENSQLFKTIFNGNWSDRNINDMEEAVEEVKHRVIHELIPAAGSLNSLGAPGVIVYIPCQIIGGLAIAHIYNPEYTVNHKYMLNVATVMIYGELAGELVWSQLVQILTPLQVKRMKLAVEPQTINVALVWDTKGYDANIVYVINPDGGNENTIKKRSLFYVAATRAKQFLAVYSSIPERNAPIMQDALVAVRKLERQLVDTQK